MRESQSENCLFRAKRLTIPVEQNNNNTTNSDRKLIKIGSGGEENKERTSLWGFIYENKQCSGM